MSSPELNALVRKLLASKKYRHLCEETIRDVLGRALDYDAPRAERKRAVGRARKQLHRIWAAYLGEPDLSEAMRLLRGAFRSSDSGSAVRQACLKVLSAHASSRERVPILHRFYRCLFEHTGVPSTVLDLACALHPLSYRWMELPAGARYRAYDINGGAVGLINDYFRLEDLPPLAEHRDVLCRPPSDAGDVAFLLKMYHCLEHRRRGAGWEVADRTPADWLVISFPVRNLSNRGVDIVGNYEPTIRGRASERGWPCRRIDFETEAVLLLDKRTGTRRGENPGGMQCST